MRFTTLLSREFWNVGANTGRIRHALGFESLEDRRLLSVSPSSPLSLDEIREVLGWPEEPVDVGNGLLFLGPADKPLDFFSVLNMNAADTTNADQLHNGGGLGLDLTGDGVSVGVWDGGQIRSTHQELTGRVTLVDTALAFSDHSTHVAGTIGASGVTASAEGMAEGVTVRSRDFNKDVTELDADDSIKQPLFCKFR